MSAKVCSICKKIFIQDQREKCCSSQCQKVFDWHKKLEDQYGINNSDRIKIIDARTGEVIQTLDKTQTQRMIVKIRKAEEKFIRSLK